MCPEIRTSRCSRHVAPDGLSICGEQGSDLADLLVKRKDFDSAMQGEDVALAFSWENVRLSRPCIRSGWRLCRSSTAVTAGRDLHDSAILVHEDFEPSGRSS